MKAKSTDVSELPVASPGTLKEIPLVAIYKSETNTWFRDETEFTEESLTELMDSIRMNGLAQPILVRPRPGGKSFELVAGERRFRAFQFIHAYPNTGRIPDNAVIPAYVRELTDDQALYLQAVENVQRKDLNPIKEALGFGIMAKMRKLSAAQIADQIGVSADYVQERLRLNSCIEPVRDLIARGVLPLKAGLKFSRIPEDQQEDALDSCVEEFNLKGDLNSKQRIKQQVFKGMDELQSWMDDHLFTDLEKADFDLDDPDLSQENGACTGCPHRSKNTGGLFDDITLEDKCLLASCFRQKQLKNYENIKSRLEEKFPGKKIIFRKRDHFVEAEDLLKKSLPDLKQVQTANIIPEKKALTDKKAELNILVGISPRSWGDHKLDTKEYLWTAPPAPVAEAKKAATKAKVKSDPDEDIKTNYLLMMKSIQFARRVSFSSDTKRWSYAILINAIISESGVETDFFGALAAIGKEFYDDDKKKFTISTYAGEELDGYSLNNEDVYKMLKPLTDAEAERVLLVVGAAGAGYSYEKHFKVPAKEIDKPAKEAADKWYKERQAQKAIESKGLTSVTPAKKKK